MAITAPFFLSGFPRCTNVGSILLSHICPYSDRPLDHLLPEVDQSTIDTSTEEFLLEIKDRITYHKWYCGHWYFDRRTSDVEFLYRKITIPLYRLDLYRYS